MRPLRASEIGEYLYCRRAWWYRRQGVPSANVRRMAEGTAFHRRHGRLVWRAMLLRTAAYALLLLALVLLAVAWAWQISGG